MKESKSISSYDAILRALFENYESIYDIDVETYAYQCYHESDAYSELKIANSGENFFKALSEPISKTIHPEDRGYVLTMLDSSTVIDALNKDKYYSFVYRLMINGKPVYHKIRATMETIDGRPHILLGIRNVDDTIRHEKAHTEALALMQQKEKNHIEAIMASAAGYIEVNLTRDLVLESSPYFYYENDDGLSLPDFEHPFKYSVFNDWLSKKSVVENTKQYAKISNRKYLLDCFARGELRASVSFSITKKNGEITPCREFFYLYQDDASGDIMSFCVVYDLTEQQRKEKELIDLENALQMSRIRNSTSQMQPHFLYNALGSIQEIVLEDPEYAANLIEDFTVYLRHCIRAMEGDALLPFDQELANIKAYVNIEKMRFGDRLNVVYDVPITDFMILPLSVQPLVENAIRHGIYERGPEGGTVIIRSRQTVSSWIIEVEDDGVGFDLDAFKRDCASGKKDSTGINNIVFRLNKVMNADVDIRSVPGTGTKIVISIPKEGGHTQ